MYDASQGETRTRTTLDLGYALTCACVAFRLCPLIHSSSLCVSMRAVLWVHSYFKIHCAASLASAPYGDHHPDSISSPIFKSHFSAYLESGWNQIGQFLEVLSFASLICACMNVRSATCASRGVLNCTLTIPFSISNIRADTRAERRYITEPSRCGNP